MSSTFIFGENPASWNLGESPPLECEADPGFRWSIPIGEGPKELVGFYYN
jgi:hypothetical protein